MNAPVAFIHPASSDAPPDPPKKKARRKTPTNEKPGLPDIFVIAGDIRRIVDAAEAALLNSPLNLYQRGGQIVYVGSTPTEVSGGRRVDALRMIPRPLSSLVEDLTSAANFRKWDARADDFVLIDCPGKIAVTLQERQGRLSLPVLTGLIGCPTLRPDGSILDKPGYDEKTGLLLYFGDTAFPPLPQTPSKDDAEAALSCLESLISTFDFKAPEHRSVALSTFLTAVIRKSLKTAPLHAFTAPVAGSGKSKLVDMASVLVSGRPASVIAQGKNDEEFEKRVASLLMAGDPIFAIDNCEGPVGGELLCQMLTQRIVKCRILGKSETPELPTGALVTATGNNLQVAGDMTRRTILCDIDPKVDRPELRTFTSDPVEDTLANRPQLVAAALTVLRAFHVAGRPRQSKPLGSFEDWSTWVRDALIWLGRHDPVETMEAVRESDIHLATLTSFLIAWHTEFQDDPKQITYAISVASRTTEQGDRTKPNLYSAFASIAAKGGQLNNLILARWMGKNREHRVRVKRETPGLTELAEYRIAEGPKENNTLSWVVHKEVISGGMET